MTGPESTPPRVEGADNVLRAAEAQIERRMHEYVMPSEVGHAMRAVKEGLAAVPRPATQPDTATMLAIGERMDQACVEAYQRGLRDGRTQPEGTTVTEWGVQSPITGITTEYGADLSDVVDLWTAAGLHVVSRQRTSYPDHVTDWEPADD